MTSLITYASRSGSTAEIAEAIGKTLAQQGISTEIQPMKAVTNIDPYQFIVDGSAVYQQKWLPEAMQFINTYKHELSQKPVATFLVGMAMAVKNPAHYQQSLGAASSWMAPIRQIVNPISEGYFAGVLDLKKIKELHFRIALISLVRLGLFSEGDHRSTVAGTKSRPGQRRYRRNCHSGRRMHFSH